MLVVNGWAILAHPLFLDQFEKLRAAAGRAKAEDAATHRNSANVKLLASLSELMFRTIPADPTRSVYRQGGTLGPDRKHWFRAKFGGQRFRLFFRYSSKAKIIIFAWVNDDNTLRAYGSKSDAYAVFKGMLDDGNPPDDWLTLLEASQDRRAQERLAATMTKP